MDELILIINNISRYGLQANVNIENKEQDLEKHLVYLYAKYFEIKDTIDSIDYPCYQRPNSANFRENISLNFPALGWYHHTINSHKVLQEADLVTGDAIDDLADISMIDVLLSVNDSTQVHALSLHHLPSPEGIPNTSTYIERLQEPVILMGDFNRVNQIIKLDNIGLIDVDSTYRMHRIDRIFITDNKLKILNIGTIPDTTRTSDHPTNYAVLKLQ